MAQDEYAREVGQRLRHTVRKLGFPTTQVFADWVGANRASVFTWYQGTATIPVRYAVKLAERGITLDWLYRGDGSGMSQTLYQQLTAQRQPKRVPKPQPRRARAARVA